MRDELVAETVYLRGHGGDEIEAYFARPLDGDDHPGVVVVHHGPGFDPGTKELVRRFAAEGYAAVCPNLHFREGPGADPDDAAAACRARGGAPDHRVIGDVQGAGEFLRSARAGGGRTGVIGFCSGARQALLAACEIKFDAVIDCYGAAVLRPPPPEWGLAMEPLGKKLRDLTCPVLGIFGADDVAPTSDEVSDLESLLTKFGNPPQFHMFADAGHAFLSSDRDSYRPRAANEAWRLIWRFLDERLR